MEDHAGFCSEEMKLEVFYSFPLCIKKTSGLWVGLWVLVRVCVSVCVCVCLCVIVCVCVCV